MASHRYQPLLVTAALLLFATALWGIGDGLSDAHPAGADAVSAEASHARPGGGENAPWQRFRTAASGIGSEEDPFARQRYRWMRLRDPETGEIPDGIRKKEIAFAKNLPARLDKASSWTPRGPENIGGRSRAVAYDVTDGSGSTILAGGASGGMWRTTDGGQSWTRTFTKAQRPSVTTIEQDPRSGETDTWYVGTGERYGSGNTAAGADAFYTGDGIYKSTDGGQTWSQLSSTDTPDGPFGVTFDIVNRVRVDPSNSTASEIYAATYGGIYRSVDGGSSWTFVLGDSSVPYSSTTDVAVTSDGVVYATMSSDGSSGEKGLWRSTDGVNWTNITPSGWPSGQNTYGRTVLGINPSDESEVWFLSQAPGFGPTGADGQGDAIGHILWRYDADAAAGSRWSDFSDYLPTRGDSDDQVPGGRTGDFDSQGGYDLLVAVHPGDASKVFVGGRNLWRLDVSGPADGADTWIGGYTFSNDTAAWYEPSGSDPHHPDQHTVAFHPSNPDVMLTGSDGGVHETEDNRASGDGGVLYDALNDGYVTTQFYQVCLNADADDPTILGGMQDNGTWRIETTNTSNEWSEVLSGDGAECEIANKTGGENRTWYVSSQNGNVVQFDVDPSGNAVPVASATPTGATGQLFIHPYELDPVDPTVLYYPAGSSLWRNAQMETSPSSGWTELSDTAVESGYQITAIRASEGNAGNVLYYGAQDADGDQTVEPAQIYRLDNADSVTPSAFASSVSGFDLPGPGYVSDIAVDPTDSFKVLVAISNYDVTSLYYSTDGGQSWTDVEGNLGGPTGPSVRSVEILPQPGLDQSTYYAATSVGLFSATSIDGSTTWTQEGPTEIGNVVVDDVEARNEDGFVLAGTHGNGVYSSAVAVPVELADFGATVSDRSVRLTWTTASETNNAGFEIRHRYRDGAFEKAAFVKGQGTTGEAQTYRYELADLPPGPHTIRLRQVDTDGTATQLQERNVVVSPTGAFELTRAAPNPFRSATRMRLTVPEAQRVEAIVYNTLGQRVRSVLDRRIGANEPVDLKIGADDLSSGAYFVRVQGERFEATRKVVVVD